VNIESKPTVFSVAEAKAKFSELLSRAEAGERLTVTRHGRPIVEITGANQKPKQKLRGALKGQIWIAHDFDELGPEWDEYVK
jgi:prevent-host-death family protein